MTKGEGWISLNRQIQEHWVWQGKFSKGQAWVDLLLLANHEDTKTICKGEIVVCKRGDVNRSIKYLAERWGWSRKTAKNFLTLLEKDNMVTTKVTTNRTTITLVNWEKYQVDKPKRNTKGNNESISEGSNEGNTYNNENNENNNNNIYNKTPSFSEFWKNYPRKQDKGMAYEKYLARLNDGYTEEELLTACKNYAAECEREKKDKKYIKHASTFLGVHEPFVEYLKGDKDQDDLAGRTDTDEEQHNAELDKFIASEEFRNGGELPFV